MVLAVCPLLSRDLRAQGRSPPGSDQRRRSAKRRVQLLTLTLTCLPAPHRQGRGRSRFAWVSQLNTTQSVREQGWHGCAETLGGHTPAPSLGRGGWGGGLVSRRCPQPTALPLLSERGQAPEAVTRLTLHQRRQVHGGTAGRPHRAGQGKAAGAKTAGQGGPSQERVRPAFA